MNIELKSFSILGALLFVFSLSHSQYFHNASNLESASGLSSNSSSLRFNNGSIGFSFIATPDPVFHVNGSVSNQVMGQGLVNKPGSGFVVLDSNQNLLKSYFWSPVPGNNPNNDYFFLTKLFKGSDGYVYLWGRHAGLADFDPGPGVNNLGVIGQSNTEAFVIKLDTDGDFLWVKRFSPMPSTNGYMNISDVMETPSGDLRVVGNFRGTMDFDGGPGTSYQTAPFTGNTGFVMLCDTAANLLSLKTINGTVPYYLGQSSSGGWVMGGATYDSTNVNLTGGTPTWLYADTVDLYADGFIAAYAPGDNLLWAAELPGEYISFRMVTDAQGNIFTGSTVADGAVLGNGSVLQAWGGSDIVLERFDPTGTNIWSRVFAAPDFQFLSALELENDAVYTLHSYYDSLYTQTGYSDTSLFDPIGSRNIALSIIDQDSGFHLASYAMDDDSTVFSSADIEIQGNRVDFGVYVRTAADLDPGQQVSNYPAPVSSGHMIRLSWILDPLGFPLSVQEVDDAPGFAVFPNPSDGMVGIRFEKDLPGAVVSVMDLQGKLLHSQTLGPRGGSMNLENLPKGMYLLRIQAGEHNLSTKVAIH